jgi:hypothetical protein
LRVRHVRSGLLSLGSAPVFRYFRAVLTSMPALAAANSCVSSVFDNLFNLLTWASVTISAAPAGANFDGR